MIHQHLEAALHSAILKVLPDAELRNVQVRPCPDPKFGDYQSNALMALAKLRKTNPRQLATEVLEHLEVTEWCEAVDIAGAGFLNFRLKNRAVEDWLRSVYESKDGLISKAANPMTLVVDFSSPNVAKPMHVGHIRSTLLGDCIARTLRSLGHQVIADNHVGDWGTQFGMILLGWKRHLDRQGLENDPLLEMERLYKQVHAQCEADPATHEAAKRELVELQNGNPENLAIWKEMIELSQSQFDTIYKRLGVDFDHALGESFYNPRLKSLVQEFLDRGIARWSEGAVTVFFDDSPELKEYPAVIQKSDGAANYTTTDLATLEYRITTWHPNEIVYVTDGRQQLHFQKLFAIFRRWQPDAPVKLSHVWFGSILGEDGKPFKTRSGETVKLSELLDEAEERAFQVVSERSPELPEPHRREVARVVGLGAIKYADLLPNRQSDYVFSWDKMLALHGNTAPYLQYAYARIRSIFRKLPPEQLPPENEMKDALRLSEPAEVQLAKHLIRFQLTLESVVEEYRPNYLCNYLYDLAGLLAGFYETCPVLKAEPRVRASRLALCQLSGRVLRQGLATLGIETLDQM